MSTTYPSGLTDAECACVQRHLPPLSTRGGRRTHPLRRILDAIVYVACTGCPWRYLPSNFPPWQTEATGAISWSATSEPSLPAVLSGGVLCSASIAWSFRIARTEFGPATRRSDRVAAAAGRWSASVATWGAEALGRAVAEVVSGCGRRLVLDAWADPGVRPGPPTSSHASGGQHQA